MPPKSEHRLALGAAIRELRTERALTLEQLAVRAGVHWTYLGGVERGERNPTWDVLVKLGAGLSVRVSVIASRAEVIAEDRRGHQ